MQFVWMGFLKPGETIDPAVQQEITTYLEQPYIPIRAAGALRDDAGERAGYLMVFEAENREAAEALTRESPVRAAGLYSEFHLFEYQNVVG